MLFILVILIILFSVLMFKQNKVLKKKEEDLSRYQGIIDLEEEIEKLNNEIEKKKNLDLNISETQKEIEKLNITKKNIQKELDNIQKELAAEKELVEDYGFERFVFEFDDSKEYKDAIKKERNYQRELIKSNRATDILFSLTFNNSKAEGKKAQKRASKMIIRTFNGEVDNIIKGVTFRNIDTSKNKIRKSFESLNKLNNKNNGIAISDEYLESKLKELDFNYAKKVKEEEEKERKREEKERLREQKAAEREIKKELKRQEEERKKKEKEIKLKEEILKQVTEELGLNNEAAQNAIKEIEKLKSELQEVLERETSISQAELTTAGYVYIISNIGSFGEDIFKIGLTRRLEPEQRVNELSSASVPFKYDCHGMIWSLNAVELEKELHKRFDDYRVNKVNKRKEFFKVPFNKIKEAIYEFDPKVELIEDVEAEEYYQSLAIERKKIDESLEKIS